MRKEFNYRLSTARRIIENTFEILVSRWRIFQKPIEGKSELVEKKFYFAATALHNYYLNKLITRTTLYQDLPILKTKVVQL